MTLSSRGTPVLRGLCFSTLVVGRSRAANCMGELSRHHVRTPVRIHWSNVQSHHQRVRSARGACLPNGRACWCACRYPLDCADGCLPARLGADRARPAGGRCAHPVEPRRRRLARQGVVRARCGHGRLEMATHRATRACGSRGLTASESPPRVVRADPRRPVASLSRSLAVSGVSLLSVSVCQTPAGPNCERAASPIRA